MLTFLFAMKRLGSFLLALLLLLLLGRAARAQSVGIGTAAPNAKAALDIRATDRGLLIPRLSAAQRGGITAPPQGLMVYQTDAPEGFYYFGGAPGAWVFLNPTGAGDNLGNGIATSAVNLQANALVGTGASISGVWVGVRADGGLNLGQNTAGNNVLLGYQAGTAATGRQNQFVGYQAGAATTTGNSNVFSGYQSGYRNTRGSENQFSGYQSGYSNTEGFDNQFSGYQSGYNNTTGSYNVFSGAGSGLSNTTGSYNLFSGYRSGFFNTTGSYNQFNGYGSGFANSTGNNNVFSGYQSGFFNLVGSNNQFSGYQSGYNNSTGSNNYFSGYQSGYNNTLGIRNVFSGYQSGFKNTTGNENVFLGYQSGQDNATGSYNTAIGAFSGTYQNVVSNSTALGEGAIVTTSNTIQLGGDIRLLRCSAPLTLVSDARFKTDVRADVPGLAFITRLRPVTYRFDQARLAAFSQLPAALARRAAAAPDSTRRTGFLAQDVERVTRELGFDFDGLHRPANAHDHYGLAYSQFVVPLVRAVQELSAENAALRADRAQDRAQDRAATAALLRRVQALEGRGLRAGR